MIPYQKEHGAPLAQLGDVNHEKAVVFERPKDIVGLVQIKVVNQHELGVFLPHTAEQEAYDCQKLVDKQTNLQSSDYINRQHKISWLLQLVRYVVQLNVLHQVHFQICFLLE